ncbi:hypothetical protein [Lacrimispora sp. JR3]
MKWESRHKYITYTTPTEQKCRDIRLHEDKLILVQMLLGLFQKMKQ